MSVLFVVSEPDEILTRNMLGYAMLSDSYSSKLW